MNPSAIAELEAFKALLVHGGESLTFRSVKVTALVLRNPEERKRDPRTINLNASDVSIIELLTDAVTPLPATGESFTDEFGYSHRINTHGKSGPTIKLHCIVSDP